MGSVSKTIDPAQLMDNICTRIEVRKTGTLRSNILGSIVVCCRESRAIKSSGRGAEADTWAIEQVSRMLYEAKPVQLKPDSNFARVAQAIQKDSHFNSLPFTVRVRIDAVVKAISAKGDKAPSFSLADLFGEFFASLKNVSLETFGRSPTTSFLFLKKFLSAESAIVRAIEANSLDKLQGEIDRIEREVKVETQEKGGWTGGIKEAVAKAIEGDKKALLNKLTDLLNLEEIKNQEISRDLRINVTKELSLLDLKRDQEKTIIENLKLVGEQFDETRNSILDMNEDVVEDFKDAFDNAAKGVEEIEKLVPKTARILKENGVSGEKADKFISKLKEDLEQFRNDMQKRELDFIKGKLTEFVPGASKLNASAFTKELRDNLRSMIYRLDELSDCVCEIEEGKDNTSAISEARSHIKEIRSLLNKAIIEMTKNKVSGDIVVPFIGVILGKIREQIIVVTLSKTHEQKDEIGSKKQEQEKKIVRPQHPPAPTTIQAPAPAETGVTIGLHRVPKPSVAPSGGLQSQTPAAPAPARTLASLAEMSAKKVKEDLKGLGLEGKKIDEFVRSIDTIASEFKGIGLDISVPENERRLATIKANLYRLKEIASLVQYEKIDSITKSIEEKIEEVSKQFITREYVRSKLADVILDRMPMEAFFNDDDVVQDFGKIFLEIETRNKTLDMLRKDLEEKKITDREFHIRNYNDFVSHEDPICRDFFEKAEKFSWEKIFVNVSHVLKLIKNEVDFQADIVAVDSSKSYLKELGFKGKMPEDKYLFEETTNALLHTIARNFEKIENPSPEDSVNDLLEEVDVSLDELKGTLSFGVTEEQEREAMESPESVIENNIALKTLGLTAKEVKNTGFKGSEVFGEVIKFIKNKTMDCFKQELEKLGFSGKIPEYAVFFPETPVDQVLISYYHTMVDTLAELNALNNKNKDTLEKREQAKEAVKENIEKIEALLEEIKASEKSVFDPIVKFAEEKINEIKSLYKV